MTKNNSNDNNFEILDLARKKFDDKYGEESKVMRAILQWNNMVSDFNRPYNNDMSAPVTEADLDSAENKMLTEIRQYGAQKKI